MIIESIFNIPLELLVYMLVFFVLGFLIYAFMYGAIGSTASKLEDINTSVMPITMLFIIAILIGSTVGVGVLAAKIYRVGVLMYGTTPKIGNIIKAVWKA